MNVRDLMTTSVQTCSPGDTLERAAQIMWDSDCGAIPIVAHDGHTIGILTDRDVSMAAYTQGKPLSQIPVWVAASNNVVSLHPEDTLDLAQALMEAARIRRLPVVDDDGRAVGLIGLGDFARSFSRPDGPSADTIARTLAAVSQPRPAEASEPRHARHKHGPLYQIRYMTAGWEVFDRHERRVSEPFVAQADAVIHAKELARRDGSAQIVVHDRKGKVMSDFIYQRDERAPLFADDSARSMAATHVAHRSHY